MRQTRRTLRVNQSVFVSMLPQMDQTSLYNGINFSLAMADVSHLTIHRTSLSALWCPSDTYIDDEARFAPPCFIYPPTIPFITTRTSYAACSGTWYHSTLYGLKLRELVGLDNGVAFVNSSIRPADITDGLSQTIALGERALGRLPVRDSHGYRIRDFANWWFDASFAETLFWTFRPINSPPSDGNTSPTSVSCQQAVAGSYHPNGANFAFADGSVHFLTETIDCWPMNYSTYPVGVDVLGNGRITMKPGTHLGVYQALSTRAGGEVVELTD